MAGVTVAGAARLSGGLESTAGELAALGAGHRDAAGIIARAIRPPRRSGRLASSVRVAAGPDSATVTVAAPYAAFVEYGDPSRGIRGRPFLRPAVESTRATWLEAYGRAVQTVLDDVRGV